ncbi:Predicted arabinose efflux permease, MFS family [Algoriphagus alkaliphilus]|uniref:Predicted arabinose efflux permease, MFS family n=1 Tax=Algoriphagus alkaliphilus TaxID=279824 RepID=A0A1G5V9W6_9BACT|nr:MFS transporter [Algoriphagus alkaliphilus]MBA4299322.1 MFS transporter [Cyclobacterium sp.]SDA42652.1 Predicted arabinose efflux permease, MFS family [Algoriphagus alkaliphilus]
MNYLSKRRTALGAMFFFVGLCFASWAARIPDIQAKFELSEGQLGTMLLFLPLGSLLGLPLAGWAVHQYGSRRVIMIGSFAYAMTLPLIGLSPSVLLLIPVLILYGLLGNVMNISLNTQALDLEDQMGKSILASFHGLWSTAGFVGAGLGAGMIFINILPELHFLIIMGISFFIIIAAQRFILKEQKVSEGSGLVIKKPDSLLLRIGLIAFLGMMCEGCMFDWSGVYFKKVILVDPSMIALGYVAFMGAMASGRFVTDKIAARFTKVAVIQVSGVLIFVGLALSVAFPTVWSATLGFLLVGFGIASIIPLSYSIAGRSKLYSPSVALALVSTISFFGFLLGPPLIGFIAELFDLKTSFALIAVSGIGITLLSSIRKQVFLIPQKVKSMAA